MSLVALGLAAGVGMPTDVEPKVVGVSIFKNGYSLVARRFEARGAGEYVIEELPNPTLGTFWIVTDRGVTLRSAVATTLDKEKAIPVGSLDELLRLNVGRPVALEIEGTGTVEGTLEAVQPDFVALRNEAGLHVFPRARVKGVRIVKGGDVKRPAKVRGLRLRVEGSGGVTFLGLEPGLSWSAAHWLDLTDPKRLTIVTKGTIVNDLTDLGPVDARLYTGFPYVQYLGHTEPLFSVPALLGTAKGLLPPGVETMSFDPTDNSIVTERAGMRATPSVAALPPTGPTNPTVDTTRELFFYVLRDLALKRGDRGYHHVVQIDTPYERLFAWDVAVNSPPESQSVWLTARFRNASQLPITSGPATAYENDQLVGQSYIEYVPAGGETEVRLTTTRDIRVESIEEEVSRDRRSLERPNHPVYDLARIRGALTIENRKKEAVTMRVRVPFEGKVEGSDPKADVQMGVQNLHQVNPNGRLEWKVRIDPGEKRTLTYRYAKYVPSA